ncbi:MAG: DNA polymerase III subunit epsilon [Lysobacterales bacterium]|nr:DNA polymerase III subunit epsilon [Xanthomonadales bacterium]MCB1610556.1 DNA polymerase III subunit epsilon [Xanthomonadales bacterium]
MRQVALDTETTGMDIAAGNRILEIGCIEIVQRVVTGRKFHVYLNPDRDSEPGALQVHGLTREFLADKPQFADVVDELLDFIDGAELLIHNASFDLGFLNHELKLLSRTGRIEDQYAVLDTLTLARQLHPGQRNSLDALCKRYQVDNSGRSYHGALLDARLLADVYLAMTAGQGSLSLDMVSQGPALAASGSRVAVQIPRRRATDVEISKHEERVAELEKKSGNPSLWRDWAV